MCFRTSLVVQWLRLHASSAVGWREGQVRSLDGELSSHMLRGAAKK